MKNEIWKCINRLFPKDAHQKSEGGGVSEVRFKKTRLLHLENVEKHLIRTFLRNGGLRVKFFLKTFFTTLVASRETNNY